MDLIEQSNIGNEEIKTESSYTNAANYWIKVPATVDGMLGGFGFISRTDINGSKCFLKQLFKMKDSPDRDRAVDCGAGIGRITKNLLINLFEHVDLVEQNSLFLNEALNYIGPSKTPVHLMNIGLQHFVPEVGTYDLIWCQWVLGHLTDDDLVDFFKSCIYGLKPKGVIVVKENITSTEKVEVDDTDSSVTRPLYLLQSLFQKAGLKCIKEQKQKKFPKGIYEVRMFALRPIHDKSNDTSVNQILTDVN